MESDDIFTLPDNYYIQGNYTKASQDYTDIIQKLLYNDPIQSKKPLVEAHQKLGQTYLKMGQYSNASDFFIKALNIQDANKDNDNDILRTYSLFIDLGKVYLLQCRYAEALVTLEKALKGLLDNYPEQSNMVAVCYNYLGLLKSDQGDYNLDREYLEKAMKIAQSEGNQKILSTTYYFMGTINMRVAKYGEMFSDFEKSLAMKQEIFGNGHPNTLGCLTLLGHGYICIRKVQDALQMLKQALELGLEALGAEHPTVATIYYTMSLAYFEGENPDEAMENLEKALKIWIKTLGPEHPNVAKVYTDMGDIYYYYRNEYQKTLEYEEKALKIFQKVFGESHPKIASVYDSIASAYVEQSIYDKALPNLQKSLDIRKEFFGTKHPTTAYSYYTIGHFYHVQEDYCKALDRYTTSLKIYQKNRKNTPRTLVDCFYNVGLIFAQMKNTDFNRNVLQKSLQLDKENRGGKHEASSIEAIRFVRLEQQRDLLGQNHDINV